MSGVAASDRPTLLRVLVTRQHLLHYESFRTRFERAARELAKQEHDPRLASATIGRRQYERWLSRRLVQQPFPDACRVLEYMFKRPVHELFSQVDEPGVAPADHPSPQEPGAIAHSDTSEPRRAAPGHDTHMLVMDPSTAGSEPMASGLDGDDMQRRVVLRGLLGGVGPTLSAPVLEAIDAVRRSLDTTIADDADPGMLDEWERRADHYTHAYLVTPPAALLADALLDFSDVQKALTRGEYGRQRARLWRLSAQLAGMIGLSLYVLGQHRDARAWYHTGRRAARLCDDTNLQAWMYVRAAGVSLHYGTPTSALELADQAARLHLGPSSATARAHVIRSRALARMNDRSTALHALDQATAAFASLDGQDAANKAFGYTERQFLAHSANAMTTLRDTKAAQRLRDQAFAGFAAQGSSEPLDPVLAKLDEARCLLWQSDPTQACHHVIDAIAALPSGHRTGLVRLYAFSFANELTPDQQRRPAGAELKESLRSAFASAPAA